MRNIQLIVCVWHFGNISDDLPQLLDRNNSYYNNFNIVLEGTAVHIYTKHLTFSSTFTADRHGVSRNNSDSSYA